MIYRILKFIITLGIRLYYKEIRIQNREKLPKSGPMILVANHPNTVIDGWVLGMLYKEPIYYMAKATFFNSPLKKWILTSLKMIPINRATESKIDGVNNIDSFSACYDLLNKGGILVIFPEGTSYKERVLREIKTGAARIAIEFSRQKDYKSGLKIVSAGINYSQAEKFRSRILVDINNAIDIDSYKDAEGHVKEKVKVLTNDIRTSLESVLVTSTDKFQDELMEKLQALYRVDKKIKSGVRGKMTELREISKIIDALAITRPYVLKEVDELATEINTGISLLGIKSDYLTRGSKMKSYAKEVVGSILLLILGLPMYVFGVLHNVLQYSVTDFIIPKITKDIEYYAPLGIILGIVFYPLVYMGFGIAVNHFLEVKGWYLLTYIALMPLCGLFAIMFHKNLVHVLYKWKFYLLLKHKRNEVELLKAKYAQLEGLLDL